MSREAEDCEGGRPGQEPHEALARLADRFWSFQCAEFPLIAIQAGARTIDDHLLRDRPEDHERRAAFAGEMLGELDAIHAPALDPQDKATLGLLRRELRTLVDIVRVDAHLRPVLASLGVDFMLSYWAGTTTLATPDDARRYLARLARVPDALEGVSAALAEGARRGYAYPRTVVAVAIAQVRGQAAGTATQSAFFGPFAVAAGRSKAMAEIADAGRDVIAGQVYPAYAAYADFLERELLPKARDAAGWGSDVDGDAFYRHHVKTHTTVEDSPEAIHALGHAEVSRIAGEMEAVAAQAGFAGDLKGFQRRLATDNGQFAESAEALREQIEVLSKRIDGRIPEFFGRTPRATYGVRTIPAALAEKLPPAYAAPGPADGSAAGVHWVTSLPRMLPRYMHLPMALHEAWPGHLMHIALIQEMDQLPAFRRYGALNYSACLEGWALYSERLGEEMGLYDTPEKRYGRLEMEMWRAVRLVVDTGLHAKGWSREEAIAFFQDHMAMPLETITSEVDRYIAMPGQALAYQIGNLKFRALRQRAQAALGEGFEIRAFHDALMSAGAVTLPVLEDHVDGWIAARRGAPAV